MKNENELKIFVLETSEVHKQNYKVLAKNKDDAIEKLKEAKMWENEELGVEVYGDLEYSHTMEDISVYDYK